MAEPVIAILFLLILTTMGWMVLVAHGGVAQISDYYAQNKLAPYETAHLDSVTGKAVVADDAEQVITLLNKELRTVQEHGPDEQGNYPVWVYDCPTGVKAKGISCELAWANSATMVKLKYLAQRHELELALENETNGDEAQKKIHACNKHSYERCFQVTYQLLKDLELLSGGDVSAKQRVQIVPKHRANKEEAQDFETFAAMDAYNGLLPEGWDPRLLEDEALVKELMQVATRALMSGGEAAENIIGIFTSQLTVDAKRSGAASPLSNCLEAVARKLNKLAVKISDPHDSTAKSDLVKEVRGYFKLLLGCLATTFHQHKLSAEMLSQVKEKFEEVAKFEATTLMDNAKIRVLP